MYIWIVNLRDEGGQVGVCMLLEGDQRKRRSAFLDPGFLKGFLRAYFRVDRKVFIQKMLLTFLRKVQRGE